MVGTNVLRVEKGKPPLGSVPWPDLRQASFMPQASARDVL